MASSATVTNSWLAGRGVHEQVRGAQQRGELGVADAAMEDHPVTHVQVAGQPEQRPVRLVPAQLAVFRAARDDEFGLRDVGERTDRDVHALVGGERGHAQRPGPAAPLGYRALGGNVPVSTPRGISRTESRRTPSLASVDISLEELGQHGAHTPGDDRLQAEPGGASAGAASAAPGGLDGPDRGGVAACGDRSLHHRDAQIAAPASGRAHWSRSTRALRQARRPASAARGSGRTRRRAGPGCPRGAAWRDRPAHA